MKFLTRKLFWSLTLVAAFSGGAMAAAVQPAGADQWHLCYTSGYECFECGSASCNVGEDWCCEYHEN